MVFYQVALGHHPPKREMDPILWTKNRLSSAKRLLSRMPMGRTPQIPITRAIQRNEEEIQRWRVNVLFYLSFLTAAGVRLKELKKVSTSGDFICSFVPTAITRKICTPVPSSRYRASP